MTEFPIGNWQSETANGATTTFTANALNQYTTITNAKLAAPQNPSYDLNGNMTSDGQGNTYVYDEENRLIEADALGTASPSSTSLTKVVSVYDELSRLVEKRTYDSRGTIQGAGGIGSQFLNVERNLLRDRGWTFNSKSSMGSPPKQ